MAGNTGAQRTFLIKVLNQQNSTWQGTVAWVDRKEAQPFRSLLELIKLIDSALGEENAEEQEADTEGLRSVQ